MLWQALRHRQLPSKPVMCATIQVPDMRLPSILIRTGVIAAVLLSGPSLFTQQSRATPDAVEQKCIENHRASLSTRCILLPEGVTWEEFEAQMLAFCDCVGREAGRKLTKEEQDAIVQELATPAIQAKLAAVYQQCRPE
jgi:hypothetical protein